MDWAPWQSWSDCSKSCGNGVQTRMREGKGMDRSCKGSECDEDRKSTKPCLIKPCIEEESDQKVYGYKPKKQEKNGRRKSRGRKRGPNRSMSRKSKRRNHRNVTHQRKPDSE